MSLFMIADWFPYVPKQHDIVVQHLACHSQQVRPKTLFFAIRGQRHDGHNYIAEAVKAGAVAIVCQRPIEGVDVPQIVVPNPAAEYARSVFRQKVPQNSVTTIGITGTNGKTTTTWMLQAILQAAGRLSGLMGTVETYDGKLRHSSTMTTADPVVLADHYRRLHEHRCDYNVMEVSSHALDQQRCAALQFSAAAITNVTHDHLDYHGSLAEYRRAKSLLADQLAPDVPLIVNFDNEGCRVIANTLIQRKCVGFAIDDSAACYRARILSRDQHSQRLRLNLDGRQIDVRLPYIGRHNAENALAAAALAMQLKICVSDIATGLESVRAVPGRLERIDVGQPFLALVDYAHTADALQLCLATLREHTAGRIICVFGAGGDRDRAKRPLMGQAASAADHIILTSDNPRSENPQEIIRQIREGLSSDTPCEEIPDRQTAIEFGCRLAEPDDLLLVAGKGHEGTQHFADTSFDFDDRSVLRSVLQAMTVSDN